MQILFHMTENNQNKDIQFKHCKISKTRISLWNPLNKIQHSLNTLLNSGCLSFSSFTGCDTIFHTQFSQAYKEGKERKT